MIALVDESEFIAEMGRELFERLATSVKAYERSQTRLTGTIYHYRGKDGRPLCQYPSRRFVGIGDIVQRCSKCTAIIAHGRLSPDSPYWLNNR